MIPGALSSVDRITKESIRASLTVFSLSVISTGLVTRAGAGHVAADTVTIALTRGTRGVVPLLPSTCPTRV